MNLKYFFWNSKQFQALELQGTVLGFNLYSAGHLIWLAVIIISAILTSSWYCGERTLKKRKDAFLRSNAVDVTAGMRMPDLKKRRRGLRKFFAVMLFLMEVSRDTELVLIGYFSAEYLPLHLCSYAIIAMAVDAFAENEKVTAVTGQLLAYAFMPGAISALLFCNWSEYPFLNFMNIHSFLFHGWIVVYVVMRLRAGEIRPDYAGLWKTVLMILLLAPPVFCFNREFGTNFMFLNEASEGSPLVPIWELLGTRFGYPGYLTGCALLVIVVFHILWLVYFLLRKGMDRKV